jgi:acyl-CoA synthetase (NDP forming)
MKEDRRRARLHRALAPRSLVYLGGAALVPAIAYARKLGFAGRIDVINPSREEIAGIACVRSAAELPAPPDLAFVAVPAPHAADALRDLVEAGVGAAVVSSAGFAETDAAGAARQEALVEAAGDMPFLGPNCPGFVNYLDRAGIFLDDLGCGEVARGVAVVSNGGAYLADIACADRSLPLAFVAGLGNQADVSVAEFLDVILDDPRVTAVNLYFESLREVARLSRCAAKAARKGIPIVAIKAGRSDSGARAAASHTAAMVGAPEIASALFARLGFVEASTAGEAMETLKMLSIAGAPKGRRIALATSSGTYAVMGADMAERAGLVLPDPAPETKAAMAARMEPFLLPGNPADIATAQFWEDERQRPFFDAFLADDFDLAVQIMSFPAEDTWEDESWYRSSATFARAAAERGLPAAFVAPTHEGLPKRARDMLAELGSAPLQGLEDGMRAIAHAAAWREAQERIRAAPDDAILLPQPARMKGAAPRVFDEAEAKDLLDAAGIPTPRRRILEAAADPLSLDLSYPLALKALHAEIAHKSELGAVALNLPDAGSLAAARDKMAAGVRARAGLTVERFVVEEMAAGGVAEILVGVRHLPEVGQALTLAVGGVATELLKDTATLLLPASRNDIAGALERLRLYPLLTGWRGAPRADISAALDAIQAICGFAALQRTRLLELEVNPLIVREQGRGVLAVDAVLRMAAGTGGASAAP